MFKKKGKSLDYFLLGVVFLLTFFGLIILTSASSDIGKLRFDNSYYYLKHQLLNGLLLGIAGFLAAYFVPTKILKTLAPYLLGINIILLILVFTGLGVESGGATRWLKMGPITFQPAELLKLTYIIFIAAWLSNSRANRGQDFRTGMLPFLIISGIVGGLLVMQPATSTVAILLGSGLVMYMISGAKFKYVVSVIGIGLAVLVLLILTTPYRMTRVMSFFKQDDNAGANYHLNQARIAIGSGQITGIGFGESTAKVTYLPAVIDDSIFAVAAQELGFIGASGLILLFCMLTVRLFWLALKNKDQFSRLTLAGFGCIIALQSIVNIGAISGLMPLTGVPLPFISYGGTALAIFLTMSGLALNMSKTR